MVPEVRLALLVPGLERRRQEAFLEAANPSGARRDLLMEERRLRPCHHAYQAPMIDFWELEYPGLLTQTKSVSPPAAWTTAGFSTFDARPNGFGTGRTTASPGPVTGWSSTVPSPSMRAAKIPSGSGQVATKREPSNAATGSSSRPGYALTENPPRLRWPVDQFTVRPDASAVDAGVRAAQAAPGHKKLGPVEGYAHGCPGVSGTEETTIGVLSRTVPSDRTRVARILPPNCRSSIQASRYEPPP